MCANQEQCLLTWKHQILTFLFDIPIKNERSPKIAKEFDFAYVEISSLTELFYKGTEWVMPAKFYLI